MWRIKSLTETFGECGKGWYFEIVRLWTEKSENTNEVCAFAQIRLFIKWDNEWGKPIEAVGGNKLDTFVKSKSYYKVSDEAYKMALTDAFGVACKYLGMGANVYWDNDKTKYTYNNEPIEQQQMTPKTPQRAYDNSEREKRTVAVVENARKLNIRANQEASGCPDTVIINFMKAVNKHKFDDLTEQEYNDLFNLVRKWKP